MTERFNASELLAVIAARQLRDDTTVFAGVGVPLLAAALAKQRHAPRLTMVIEGGIIGPQIAPGRLPVSTNEMRAAHRATMLPGITDAFLFAQRGFVDVGFMGGAQIDRFGNLNSSFIGDAANPSIRLPGTGGGNDISSLTQMIVAMKHEKRRFVEAVDFITSPGWIEGRASRAKRGLIAGGMWRVVTDLAVMGFDEETREMKVLALHPGVSAEEVQANTGFALAIDPKVARTPAPLQSELDVLRELDPERLYTA